MKTELILDHDDLLDRAHKAYFRAGGTAYPNSGHSGVAEHGADAYVVLRTGSDILAVYRVRSSGELRRIEEWPAPGVE